MQISMILNRFLTRDRQKSKLVLSYQQKCPMNLALFIYLYIYIYIYIYINLAMCMQNLRITHQFFKVFYMKLESHKGRKVRYLCFWKIIPAGKESPKSHKKWLRYDGLGIFTKDLIHSYVLFELECKSTDGFLTAYLGKNCFLNYVPKTFTLIGMQDSLNCNISQTRWGAK